MGNDRTPVRVAAVNDYELVVAGVAQLLSKYPDQVEVCERMVVGESMTGSPVDVALYDTYGRVGVAAEVLSLLASLPNVHHVAVFSSTLSPALIADGRRAGASGFISKNLRGDDIADALVRIAAGEEVLATGVEAEPALDDLDWPGKADGLTERESRVLVLISQGLTNSEIAEALYLGVETVKTHVRRILAKLKLRNRAQAAAYAAQANWH